MRARRHLECPGDRPPPDRGEPARPAVGAGVRRGGDHPPHPRVGREGRGPPRDLRAHGRPRAPRRAGPHALGRLRHGLHQLRDDLRGARARRHGVPGRPERPRRAQLADAHAVGDRRAEAALARAPGEGREAGDVRPDRARRGHGRGESRLDRPPRRRFVRPERPEDLDQPRRHRGPLPRLRVGGSGEGPQGRDRVRARAGHEGPLDRDAPRQARHPRRQHRADQHGRRPRADREPDRRGGRGLPDRDERDRPGPLHGRGRGRRARAGVPRRVAQVRPRARARSATRSASTSS